MKKIVLVFASLLTISFQLNAQWFWQNPLPQGNALYCVKFISSDVGWAVGIGGTILRTTNGGVTFIENEENNFVQPKEFLLQQNYPNPFNPSTKISWQSPVSSWQTIKVYDMLGNEMVTLVDEEKVAGSYEVEFDGTCLSSGIYFCRLMANNYSGTIKMLVLK